MHRITMVLATVLLVSGFAAGAAHPFSIHDMLAMQRVSDAQVSPDGKWVLHGLRTTDLEANKGRTDLWLTAIDSGDSRQLTTDPASDYNGRWSRRQIYFLSTRSGASQVWKIDPREERPSRSRTCPSM